MPLRVVVHVSVPVLCVRVLTGHVIPGSSLRRYFFTVFELHHVDVFNPPLAVPTKVWKDAGKAMGKEIRRQSPATPPLPVGGASKSPSNGSMRARM